MTILSKMKSHSDAIKYFKELPFYNKPIKRLIKRLKNIHPLFELPFDEQLSVIKTDQAFKGYEILYMIDVWINNGSGWIIELIESQYINISTYRPLSGSSHVDLPIELKVQEKDE